MHEYEYDNGRVARVIVTREVEWDDTQRKRMQALAEYEAGVCSCGLHRSIADDDPAFDLEDHVCPVCAALDREIRVRDKLEHEAESNEIVEKKRPSDGRTRTLRLLRPDEIVKRSMIRPGETDAHS